MKQRLFLITLVILFAACCKNQQPSQTATKVMADSLIANIDKYRNSKIEVEGFIIHVCGVDGKKMKLKTKGGGIIKIVATDSISSFDKSFNKKKIRVMGIVEENCIDKTYIDKVEKKGTLLCHIDNTPCKDSAWISSKIKSGAANKISKRDIEKLRRRMEQSGKNYVSTVTVRAEKVEIIN